MRPRSGSFPIVTRRAGPGDSVPGIDGLRDLRPVRRWPALPSTPRPKLAGRQQLAASRPDGCGPQTAHGGRCQAGQEVGRLETANQRTIPASRIWAGGRRRRWQWEARVTRMTRTSSDRDPCWLRPVLGGRSDPARVTRMRAGWAPDNKITPHTNLKRTWPIAGC